MPIDPKNLLDVLALVRRITQTPLAQVIYEATAVRPRGSRDSREWPSDAALAEYLHDLYNPPLLTLLERCGLPSVDTVLAPSGFNLWLTPPAPGELATQLERYILTMGYLTFRGRVVGRARLDKLPSGRGLIPFTPEVPGWWPTAERERFSVDASATRPEDFNFVVVTPDSKPLDSLRWTLHLRHQSWPDDGSLLVYGTAQHVTEAPFHQLELAL